MSAGQVDWRTSDRYWRNDSKSSLVRRFAQSRVLGRKVSDEFTVPLCRGHHRELHHSGDAAAWWAKVGFDPTRPARVRLHARLQTGSLEALTAVTPYLHCRY
jgi:hypothetical protein